MMARILLFLLCSITLDADCVPVAGEHILAGDLARAVPAFAGLSAELVLGYAPALGGRRAYSAAELERLARRYGLTVEPGTEACLVRRAGTLSRERVVAAMQAVIPQAHIEVLDFSRQPVPPGELHFPTSGLGPAQAFEASPTQLWRGQIQQPGQDDFPVWAKVRILVSGTRAMASEALWPGRPIELAQIRLEHYEGPPGQPDPSQIVGRAPRRMIPAGAAIDAQLLGPAEDILSGDTVRVEVWSGRARLVLEGQAQSSGRRGETIPVRNPATGKIFRAKVQGRGRVLVAPGWSAPGGNIQ